MANMTLEELKAKNASEEAEATKATAAEEVEADDLGAEDESLEPVETAESEQEEGEEAEVEAWMQADEQTSDDSGKAVPVAKHAQMRSKLKGTIREQASELEQLKAELEALKAGRVKPVQAQPEAVAPMPMLENFDYDQNKYAQAMQQWVSQQAEAKVNAALQGSQQKQSQKAAQERFAKALDDHYDRAANLVATQGISAELYQAADTKFRSVVEAVAPGRGDAIADQLISSLGEGSEKVGYFLGRNSEAQAMLQSKLMAGDGGIQAAIYLGELKRQVTSPARKQSMAPKPAPKVGGNEPAHDLSKRLKREYREAANDPQKRIDTRRKARAAGLNPDEW